jgi:hypothetical protein
MNKSTKFQLIQALAWYVMKTKNMELTEISWKLASRRVSIKLDLDYPK